jgi:hypothetical protein
VLAALWIGINLLFPGLAPTGIPSAITRLAIHVAILAGLWLAQLSQLDLVFSDFRCLVEAKAESLQGTGHRKSL